MENFEPQLDEKTFKLDKFFDMLYLGLLLALVVYGIYIGFNWGRYSSIDLMRMSYWYVPLFVFNLVGIIKIKSPRSLIYALCSIPASLLLLVLFYEEILGKF